MWTISSASGGKDLFYVVLIWSLISFCIAKTSSTKQIGQEMDEELQEVKKSLIFPSLAVDARGGMETVDTTTSITACLHDKSINI
ncbi:hypothetical protein RDI58_021524 [Solanum bulbocastanum]|uniref:Uncharacterized protein n=1 Tax=Solanum bulbocastanum TaxID=147425 RepID=A0AAN8T2N1_SOLBU